MDNNIEHIILNKKYEELNSDELSAISEYISSALEYEQIREILYKIKFSKEEIIVPESSVKEALLNKFRQANSQKILKIVDNPSKGKYVLLYRLAYAALIAVGLFVAFLLYRNSGNKEILTSNKLSQPQKQHSTKPQKSENYKTFDQNIDSINNYFTSTIDTKVNITQKDTVIKINIPQDSTNQLSISTTNKGRPLKEDIALMDIMYVAL